MKILVIFNILILSCIQDVSDGSLVFRTFSPPLGINAPVVDVDGKTRLTGTNYLAQLYASVDIQSLRPVGFPVPFNAGIFTGYINRDDIIIVPRTMAVGSAFVQMRAWRARDGDSYEEAVKRRGHFGISNLIYVYLGCLECVPQRHRKI